MIYKPLKRNTPVATLIKNYINKKSGKVSESRNEIQKRFEHLDWKDQKKILMAFLDSCKSDRQWAYSKLYHHWDKSFEAKVKDVWDRLHEPMCAWSIIRFFPISSLFLEKIKQTNVEVQKLMDAFELEPVNGDIPF